MTTLFANRDTARFLRGDGGRVYLYGGYEGFHNFGDVLQVKSMIRFHRATSGQEPIPVLALTSLTDRGFPDRIRTWLGVEHILWESDERVDARSADLEPLDRVRTGGYLHVYGGGYLNRNWGARRVEVLGCLVDALVPADFIASGVQLDETVVASLGSLFTRMRPSVFGVRDRESERLARLILPPDIVDFSFDDIIEPLVEWAARVRSAGSGPRDRVAIHMNSTAEYLDPAEQLSGFSLLADRIRASRPDLGATLVQAYDDRRTLVRDTLECVKALDGTFPFAYYDVVDLARESLVLDAADPRPDPGLASALGRCAFAVCSSYHTAMTLQLAGIPAYLVATNEFYRQKRTGLGLTGDLDGFLAGPEAHRTDFADLVADRASWIRRLSMHVSRWSSRAAGVLVQSSGGNPGRRIPLEFRN